MMSCNFLRFRSVLKNSPLCIILGSKMRRAQTCRTAPPNIAWNRQTSPQQRDAPQRKFAKHFRSALLRKQWTTVVHSGLQKVRNYYQMHSGLQELLNCLKNSCIFSGAKTIHLFNSYLLKVEVQLGRSAKIP